MRILRRSAFLFLGVWTASAVGGEEPSAEAVRFFETKVRPVFAEHCIHCHGPTKQWSGFRMDSREALLKGGDYGDDVIPGNPDESLLVMAIKHDPEIEDLAMPPPPEKQLSERQVADIVEWIRQGAAFPETEVADYDDPQKGKDHWAFQPLDQPEPPKVKDADWAQTPIDQFILAKLEAEGLKPAPKADKRALIRRATFDLTGLPPSPDEVAAFLADDRPDAFARVVDRLLASPAYGERWGRMWLDVARYADSNGLDENVAHGNAWRYRDYVVESFNKDKPYRDFVVEQLAGDLLSAADNAQRAEQLTATGFLSLGPKVLAEPDKVKMEMDIIDEQVDTTGRALLGMTIGCARCHDHKFDPISAADYYGLAGVFKSTLTMDSFKTVAKWHENPLPDAEAEAQIAAHAKLVEAKKAEIEAAGKEPESEEKVKALQAELAELEKKAPEAPSAMGVAEGEPQDLPIHVRGDHLRLGDIVSRRAPEVFQAMVEPPNFPNDRGGRLELAQWVVNDDNALAYRVIVNRVWRWRMGAGIVRTPDNFGLLGEAPTHPELLDWLAAWFIDNGTSIKKLHRMMMLSSVYQQSSTPDAATLAQDVDNNLWGRMPVRRLEAEEIRDALLAVGGELDRTIGGSLLTVANRGYFFDHTSKDATTYGSARRSIYMPVVRNNLYEVFQLLDFPDPAVSNGDRATTTIAPQALLMLNGDVVLQSAAGLADRIRTEKDDDAKLARLYDLAYTRAPTDNEIKTDLAFLEDAQRLLEPTEPSAEARARLAWEALCQTILAANEFSYVR